MREEIEKILKEEIRPMLSMHGGGVDLIDVTDEGIVKVKLTGGCAGCPGAQMTIANVVESALKAKLPQIKKIEAV